MVSVMKFFRDLNKTDNFFTLLMSLALVLVIWSATFELDKSIQAEGEVSPMGRAISFQSEFNGRISSISVKVGDAVKKNQKIITIESDEDKSLLSELNLEVQSLDILRRRLEAQLNGDPLFEFTDNDPVVLIEDQKRALKASLDAHKQALLTLDSELKVKRKAIESSRAEQEVQKSALLLSKKKAELVEKLFDKGFEGEIALLDSRRQVEEVRQKILELSLSISGMESELDLIQAKQISEKIIFQRDTSEKLVEVRKSLDLAKIKRDNADQRVSGYVLSSGKAGVVSRVNVNYAGEVIKAGDVLVEVIPEGIPLVFYAKVPVGSIDDVKKGQLAKLVLSTMDTRSQLALDGEVISVDPDATEDDSGNRFYAAIVKANDSSGVLFPGVTGTASLLIGKRTVIEYFLEPLFASLSGALNEK